MICIATVVNDESTDSGWYEENHPAINVEEI